MSNTKPRWIWNFFELLFFCERYIQDIIYIIS